MGGGGVASKVSGAITTSIGKGAIGAGAFAGRSTIGAGANWLSQKEGFKNKMSNSRAGMAMLKGVNGIAGSSFDARGSRAFKGVGAATGITNDFGKAGGKGGYAKSLDDRAKSRADFNKKALGGASPVGSEEAASLLNSIEGGDIEQSIATSKQLYQTQKASGTSSPETLKKMKANYEKKEAKLAKAMENGARLRDVKNRKESKGPDLWNKGANKKAAEEMMKELFKDKDDARFDKLEALVKESSKDKDD